MTNNSILEERVYWDMVAEELKELCVDTYIIGLKGGDMNRDKLKGIVLQKLGRLNPGLSQTSGTTGNLPKEKSKGTNK